MIRIRKRIASFSSAFVFILPFLIGLFIFFIIPIFMMLYYSFFNEGSFVALKNYKELFSNGIFIMAFGNTLKFVLVGVSLLTILSLLLALLVKNMTFYREYIQSFMFAPLIVPTVSVIMISNLFFQNHGLLWGLLNKMNIEIDFYNTSWAFFLMIVFYIWKNIGYNLIIFTAAMENVSADLYEAAEIDGASSFQQFIYITIPSIKNTSIFVIMISTLNAFKSFREIFLMLGAYPDKSVYSLQHYMNNLFYVMDLNKLSSIAIVILLMLLVFVLLMTRFDKEKG